VTIVKPNAVNSLKEYDVLILYQPNIAFKRIFEENTAVRLPTFIITGTTTDFPLLNQQQSTLVFKMSNQKKIIWLVLIRNLIYLYLIILVSKISLL
jgi:hypothetical protein